MSETCFPDSREQYLEDAWFFVKVGFVIFLGLSISDDIPEIDRGSSYPRAVEGECKRVSGVGVCFDTWRVLGFDTGLAPAVYRYGEVGYVRVYSEVFFRESDFLREKSSWPKGSRIHSGNYSGEIPDYNVSLVEGVGVE